MSWPRVSSTEASFGDGSGDGGGGRDGGDGRACLGKWEKGGYGPRIPPISPGLSQGCTSGGVTGGRRVSQKQQRALRPCLEALGGAKRS